MKICCRAFCSNIYRLLILIVGIAALGTAIDAQTLKADYRFQGDLNSSVAGAPAMTNLTGANGANSFAADTIDGYSRQSLRFPKDSGVAVDTNGVIPGDAYSVVVLFRFDELSGYRRVLDATGGQSDSCGLYTVDRHFEGEATPQGHGIIWPQLYMQATIVREATGHVRIYRDGFLQVDIANDQGCYLNAGNSLRFFQDDNQESGEASPGNVARIRLYDAPMNQDQISALDRTHDAVGGGDQPILFTSDRDGFSKIYSMNLDGSNQYRLTNNSTGDAGADWSAIRQRIVFQSARDGNAEIYTMNLDGSDSVRLTDNPLRDARARWSPDGSKILFSRCDASSVCDIWLMNADGTGQTNLTNNSADDDFGNWSPDGSKIVFATNRDGNYDIYTMDASGGDLTRLTTITARDTTPSFSPDGRKIVFASYRDSLTTANIYTMNADGSNQAALWDTPGHEQNPVWSPDGTQIIFTSYTQTSTPTSLSGGEVFLMGSDGSGPTRLTYNNRNDDVTSWKAPLTTFTISGQVTNGATGQSGVTVTLSGSQSATTVTDASGNYSFTVAKSGNYTVTPSLGGYTFTPASTSFNNVTANQTANFAGTSTCSYSVSTTSIGLSSFGGSGSIAVTAPAGCQWTAQSDSPWLHIFSGTPGNGNGTVEITVEQNSGSQRTGTLTIAGHIITVSQTGGHAAAGQPILFISTRDGSNEIYKMDADGANQQRLTNTAENEFGGYWSPDGQKILYGKVINSSIRQIWTMNSDGSNQTMVSDAAGIHAEFSWSPDGRKILFTKGTSSADPRIWVMNADGTGKTQLTNTPNLDHFARWSPNGSKIAFGRCDANFVCDVYTMNADGSNQTNLTSANTFDDDNPRWTADGNKLIFLSENSAVEAGVFMINADGTGRQPLVMDTAERGFLLGPVSPDGSKINLTGRLTAADSYEIFTANIDGSGSANLTNNSVYDDFGTWSPDSASLAFVSRRDTATNEIYTMNADGSGVVRLTFNSATDLITDWYHRPSRSASRRAPFDFDGDGKTDVGILRPNGALGLEWWISKSSDGGVISAAFGSSTDIAVPADYTGDGKTDVAVYRPSTGIWYILRSDDNLFYGFPFGSSTDIPAPADYDGDGKTDAAVFRSGAWYILRSSDGGVTSAQFGLEGDKPVPADFDGDGKADIAIYRPNGATGGEWWALKSSGGVFSASFGSANDKVTVGDWTGDGKADCAFYRPSTGTWYILRSEDSLFYGFPFGNSADAPAPGDYDGDGKLDAAVFRQPNEWYANKSSGGVMSATWGSAGDLPIQGTYVP